MEKVRLGVITSEPGLKLKLDKAKRFAEDPEFTIRPYFFPNKFETLSSFISIDLYVLESTCFEYPIQLNSGIGISLGNNCIVEAGLYVTSGTKVSKQIASKNEIIKASELSGVSNMLFYRDSTNGKVIATNNKKIQDLNKELHLND